MLALLTGGAACATPRPAPETPEETLEEYLRCLEQGDYTGAAAHLADDGRFGEDRAVIERRLRDAGAGAIQEARRLVEATRQPGAVTISRTRR